MSKFKSLIPNLLTAGNLVGGVLAIIFSLTGHLEWAPYCIFISAFLDFFDGFAARLLKVQSEMGKQLDSLADMVTFGVAPGVMVFQLIKVGTIINFFKDENYALLPYFTENPFAEFQNDYIATFTVFDDSTLNFQYNYLPYLAFIIPIMSMFRLAKFNLDTRQSDSFIGLPTPANTLVFAALPLITMHAFQQPSNDWQYLMLATLLNPWLLGALTLIFSILLVAELPLFALKFKTFGWKGNEIRYFFLTLAVILLATLHYLAIPILIILYILLSIIQNLLLRKKSYGG